MRRAALIIAVVLAVGGLTLALLPFHRLPAGVESASSSNGPLSDRCLPPIVSAWRNEHLGSSFAIMSASKTPPHFATPACRPGGTTRLEYTAALWFGAILLLLARRRQWPRYAVPAIAPG